MTDFIMILSFIAFLGVVLLIFFMGGQFSYWVIKKLFFNNKTIIIVPSLFSFYGGLLIFIYTVFIIGFLTYSILYNPYNVSIEGDKKILAFLIVILVICFCETFFSFSIFEKDKIIFRNIFNLLGKRYNYDDIIKVEVFIKKFTKGSKLRYLLIMKDGRKIDLNVMQLHIGYRGEKNKEASFKKILHVESLINKDIPHLITEEAYYKIRKANYLPTDFNKKFRKMTVN